MKYSTIVWIIYGILFILFAVLKKAKHPVLKNILGAALAVILISLFFLPRHIFGKWNSISALKSNEIDKITLRPSQPNWKVNLTGCDYHIYDKKQIGSLVYLFQNAEIYFQPHHPSRIWETKAIFYSKNNDSLQILISKTDNDGTIINTPTNEWRKDEVGNYLNKIMDYIEPHYSDTATYKN